MRRKFYFFVVMVVLLLLDKGGDRLDKAGTCVFQANYHFIWAVKYCRSVLFGSVEIKLVEVLKMVAVLCGFEVLTARVHIGCHVYVFVVALPKVCISDMVCLFKCNSDRLLFEFLQLKFWLWGGRLWSEGYVVHTAVKVTSKKIEEYINRY